MFFHSTAINLNWLLVHGTWQIALFILKLNGTERLLLSSGIHLETIIISAKFKLYTSDTCQVRITGKKASY